MKSEKNLEKIEKKYARGFFAVVCLIICCSFIILSDISAQNKLKDTSCEVVYIMSKEKQGKYDFVGADVVAYDFAYVDTNDELKVINDYKKSNRNNVVFILDSADTKTRYEIDRKGNRTLYIRNEDVHKQKVAETEPK